MTSYYAIVSNSPRAFLNLFSCHHFFFVVILATLSTGTHPLFAGAENQTKPEQTETVVLTIPPSGEITRNLKQDDIVELSVAVLHPSTLPDNGRLRLSWELISPDDSSVFAISDSEKVQREVDAFGIYTRPTANIHKILHALDADFFTMYRAPVTGTYRLRVQPEENRTSLFDAEGRWREAGSAPAIASSPRKVLWPKDSLVQLAVNIRSLELTEPSDLDLLIETEPNDTPEQAQLLKLDPMQEEHTMQITGSADDIEYFDNGKVGSSGDDWFRLDYTGEIAVDDRLLTACLQIPDQQVAARIRCYQIGSDDATSESKLHLLPIQEHLEGKNTNERVHQQEEQHRIAINRILKPGHVYFLRVEANTPGYELELRLVKPAPFSDPHRAVRHALYDHLGQVDSWLNNRPRGASVERRIRDTGNLLGTHCMSCHTQSGVWGPAIPLAQGYRLQNAQLYKNLINICYQSLRPTNVLEAAANNTSLPPLDIGDGPAGTRVAGHSVVSLERYLKPRRLHSKQAIRAANYILLTSDPGGINAAGPGANVGEGVVYNYAGEVLYEAWKATGEARYFHKLEEKSHKILTMIPKYTDDLGHRVEFLRRYFPKDYVSVAIRVAKKEGRPSQELMKVKTDARDLVNQIERQIRSDLVRLRAIQDKTGGWGFDPGKITEGQNTWHTADGPTEPSPTALALLAFEAAGFGSIDPTVERGVQALLNMQHPSGYWKGQSQTGFVATSYAMHALARLFPAEPPHGFSDSLFPKEQETLQETIRRVRESAYAENPELIPFLVADTKHESPLVRYWALIGLGYLPSDQSIAPLISALSDRRKMVRESAHWALRQNLIDDRGWDRIFETFSQGDDRTRAALMRAILMRVDGVMTESSIGWPRLTSLLQQGMNQDPHPAVRAWALRSSWNWWIWNPPVRESLNRSWIERLKTLETNALVENAIRYQLHALLIANGHRANGSEKHQYKELGALITKLHVIFKKSEEHDQDTHLRLLERLVLVAATYYQTAGGDGGPGQMGYHTKGASTLFGDAAIEYLQRHQPESDSVELTTFRLGLEGSANIRHRSLQRRLIDLSLHGPEATRSVAASSVSDPKSVTLAAVPELIEPLTLQLRRGANDPPRRPMLSDPILTMFARVRWTIPDTREQRDEIMQYLIPQVHDFMPEEDIKQITNATRQTTLLKQNEMEWYLSDGMGNVLSENSDLHMDAAVDQLPSNFDNPLTARFWLKSIPWILKYQSDIPEVQLQKGELPPIDPYDELRSRALRLFLTQLYQDAEPRNREQAVSLANKTALRRNPEILVALEDLLDFEKRKSVIEIAQRVLSTGEDQFLKDLKTAVAEETPRRIMPDENGKLPEHFVADFTYFRDYVIPEMTRVLRGDQRACMSCHGEPGRVPSMELHRPDDVGYLPVPQLLSNYRILQERVDLNNLESSKLLRKPLNLQTKTEDGHQGGRRYKPDDEGYLILRKWATNQINLADKPTARSSATE